MPTPKRFFENGYFYHVYNKSIDCKKIFYKSSDGQRAMATIDYYRFKQVPSKLSEFIKLSPQTKKNHIDNLIKQGNLVKIHAYCLMPDHYHLLLEQSVEGGIKIFISQFQNSFTRYFNTKYDREDYLFRGRFRSVEVVSDEQLLHVHRYIHLNPYSSRIVNNLRDLENYPYSSLSEFLNGPEGICDKSILKSFSTRKRYGDFIFNQADYQRHLKEIRKSLLE